MAADSATAAGTERLPYRTRATYLLRGGIGIPRAAQTEARTASPMRRVPAGVYQWVMSECSSAGASENIQIFTGKAEKCVSLFKGAGYKIICADLPDSVPVYDADLKRPLLLVIGGEKRGITRSVLQQSDAVVRIEYGRDFDQALSASSAASILAFEVYRQNRNDK